MTNTKNLDVLGILGCGIAMFLAMTLLQDTLVATTISSATREPLTHQPLARDGDTFSNAIGMKFVRIPAGEFVMGSPEAELGRDADENQRRVTIGRPFYMQITPVTEVQWFTIMGLEPSNFKGASRPVETVSWNDAVEFCSRLSAREHKNYRLPTEAEWEYACRAGMSEPFSGTGKLEDMGWYKDNSDGETHPVATKKPNAWGLYDMQGNVWQWCSDAYAQNNTAKSPTTNNARVLRGGSWFNTAEQCRAAYRNHAEADTRTYYIGFRVCADSANAPPLAGAAGKRPHLTIQHPNLEKLFKLPVLAVHEDGTGSCDRIEFSLIRRAASQDPLTIAIGEDTPGGVGYSVRASVWLAAMVAALERLDDLSGVRISLQIPGNADGPSAGGMICLAILSALDGKDLPDDFVMTGSIMPDGTIGAVGGISPKITAAAKAGAKRAFVPPYLRFEKDPHSGEDVDLKRLASALHLEMVPVENISQAYALAHHVESPHVLAPNGNVLELNLATEDLLKKSYAAQLTAGTILWNAYSEDEKKAFAAFPAGKLLLQMRTKGENAYRSGKLLYASTSLSQWAEGLKAAKEMASMPLPADDFKKAVDQADQKLEEWARDTQSASSLIKTIDGNLQDSGIQLCAEFSQIHELEGLRWEMGRQYSSVVAEMSKAENKGQDKHAVLSKQAIWAKVWQLSAAYAMRQLPRTLVDDATNLGGTLPSRTLLGDSAAVERLFYSALLAADNSFYIDVVPGWAIKLGVANDQGQLAMMDQDMSLAMYCFSSSAAQGLHKQFGARSGVTGGGCGGAAAAHIHAGSLAKISGLIMRWNELDVDLTNANGFRYRRTDLLNHLLNASRENALANIGECQKRDIPSVEAILCFEKAELARDDHDEDQVDVLSMYWDASLQAKVLLMLFPPNPKGNEDIPRTEFQRGLDFAKRQDFAAAVENYRKAADLGDPQAIYQLGVCYDTGSGVVKDESEAVKWYRKAADLGQPGAMTSLGAHYFSGRGVAKDENEAVRLFRKATDFDEPLAMNNLGACFGRGIGVVKNEAEAARWYRKAADLGLALAINNLGWCYQYGVGLPRDDVEAVSIITSNAATDYRIKCRHFGGLYNALRPAISNRLSDHALIPVLPST